MRDEDRIILNFEQRWIDRPGKESAILRTFGWRQARYYQRLAQVMQQPAALAAYPQLVYRLRSRLDARERWRAAALLSRED